MFHFADFAPYYKVSGLHQKGCPIRTFTDQGLLATPRNISLLAASFFAVSCHGIPRMLLIYLFFHFIIALLLNCQISFRVIILISDEK